MSDTDMDDDSIDIPAPPLSPQPVHQIPSDSSPINEQAAQEAYETAMADYDIYNLTRTFARATKALATYDCRGCLDELETLPSNHQRSAWVMAMVGKAHFELGEYAAVRRYLVLACFDPSTTTLVVVHLILLYLSVLLPSRRSVPLRLSVTWSLIGSGIWKFIQHYCGICNGAFPYPSWLKSCCPSIRDLRKPGSQLAIAFHSRRRRHRR